MSLINECISDTLLLPPDDQFIVAKAIASNLGYKLVEESIQIMGELELRKHALDAAVKVCCQTKEPILTTALDVYAFLTNTDIPEAE